MGLAIDLGRGYLLKSQLSSALDAAGLAGGKVIFSDTLGADIQMFFDANLPPGYMTASIDGPFFEVSEDNEVIQLNATATVNTTFMRVLGIPTMTVAAFTEVTRRTQLLDLVLAVDMSTSMTWDDGTGTGTSRIQAARSAATELVNILFGDDPDKPFLNMAVAPWAGKTNVTIDGVAFTGSTSSVVPEFTNPVTGADQTLVYYANNSPVPFLSAPPANWQGCVYARYLDDGDADNDADLYYGPVDRNGTEWMAWQPIGPEGEPVPGPSNCTGHVPGDWTDCRACIDHGITPLDNTKQTMLDAVSGLTSPVGVTNIVGGLFWAWHVLKPEAPFTEANPDPDFPRQQAIILLTDGEHQGGSGDAYNAVFGLGTSAGAGGMDPRLTELATRIKAEGVLIYVVQFRYNSGTLATLLQGVATSPDSPYYNFAPDGDALAEIFQEVANHLSELRLSR
ncbi:MAG: hypothetical protein GY791_14950 [Alphaproteobacteria bacterium]|nr:hypothetical protein [Alphaproteobacteria bacterium]